MCATHSAKTNKGRLYDYYCSQRNRYGPDGFICCYPPFLFSVILHAQLLQHVRTWSRATPRTSGRRGPRNTSVNKGKKKN
jgi:hypothetical protein